MQFIDLRFVGDWVLTGAREVLYLSQKEKEEDMDTVYKSEALGLYGTWEGGPYIDVFLKDGFDSIPHDTVNVFDYELGEPYDAETREQMMRDYFSELEKIYL